MQTILLGFGCIRLKMSFWRPAGSPLAPVMIVRLTLSACVYIYLPRHHPHCGKSGEGSPYLTDAPTRTGSQAAAPPELANVKMYQVSGVLPLRQLREKQQLGHVPLASFTHELNRSMHVCSGTQPYSAVDPSSCTTLGQRGLPAQVSHTWPLVHTGGSGCCPGAPTEDEGDV